MKPFKLFFLFFLLNSIQAIAQPCLVEAGNDTSICGLNFYNPLNGSINTGDYNQIWTVTGPGTVTFSPNANSPIATVTVSEAGIYTFTWTVTNQFGTVCSDQRVIEFHMYPIVNAGNDTTFCGRDGFLNATSNGNNGIWLPVAPASFGDSHSPFTTVHWGGAMNITVSFTYQASSGCETSQDAVNITFLSHPTSMVFNDTVGIIQNCGLTFNELQAPSPPANLNHYWTCPLTTGEVYTDGEISAYTPVTVPDYGIHSFYWVLENGGCDDTSAAVRINFIETPVEPIEICYVEYDTLSQKNIVLWLPSITNSIDSIFIYRGLDLSSLTKIGGALYSAGSFNDITSDPMNQAYYYKISAYDICDNESSL